MAEERRKEERGARTRPSAPRSTRKAASAKESLPHGEARTGTRREGGQGREERTRPQISPVTPTARELGAGVLLDDAAR